MENNNCRAMDDKQTNKKRTDSLRRPFFPGWLVMIAGTIGYVMTSPGQTYTISIFINHLINDLSISRSTISTLYSIGSILGGLTLPFWGRRIDKLGARLMAILISVLFGLACIYMGFVKNPVMLGLGFFAVRMLGLGGLGLVSHNVINQWWVRKRGMVTGISGLTMAVLGMGGFPVLVHNLISIFGWRVTYPILGLFIFFVMTPIAFLLFRNRPEEYGLKPDGDRVVQNNKDKSLIDFRNEDNWTLNQALLTKVFWILIFSIGSYHMISTALLFHLVSIFQDQGLSAAIAASAFVPISIATAGMSLISGVMADRVSLRILLPLGVSLQAILLMMIQFIGSVTSVFIFSSFFGVYLGLFQTLRSVVWPAYFGRKHLSSINGFAYATAMFSGALGPLPFGFIYDQFGSYQIILLALSGFSICLSIICLTVRKPVKSNLVGR
jgi:MFS transporter, OFA family, oxalate/formate antiporter